MLFDIDKNKGLALLKLVMAILVINVPSFLGFLPVSTGVYIMFLLLLMLFVVRVKTTERIFLSFYHPVLAVLLGYSLLSSLWVNNREGQLLFSLTLTLLMLLSGIVSDYLSENNTDGIKRRLMYLFSMSGLLCALVNILYWVIHIIPVAGKGGFNIGFGSREFLGIFMFLSGVCTALLIKGNSKLRKNLFFIALLAIAFVFVMCKSIIAWVFALTLTVVIVSEHRRKKMLDVFCVFSLFTFVGSIVILLLSTAYGEVFSKVFSYGIKSVFGHGGGFWSGKDLFIAQHSSDAKGIGLLAYLTASSGTLGLVAALITVVRNIMLFLKLKSKLSLISLFLTFAVMLLPGAVNLVVIILWTSVIAFNEYSSGLLSKIQVKNKVLVKLNYLSSVLFVIVTMLLFQSFIRIAAYSAYKNKDYSDSYNLYKTASIINVTDSDSCAMAVVSLRKADNLKNNREEALWMIDTAIKRDSDNLNLLAEKARIFYACEEYEMAAQQYTMAAERAVNSDRYNLSLAKVLYKIVEKYPKGSSETKRAYEEILEISATTENLDYRKEINDIADKAFGFTKGELTSER